MLDIILYSREQLVKEYNAMPEKGDPGDLPQVGFLLHKLAVLQACSVGSPPEAITSILQVPWGIISVKVGFNISLEGAVLPACCAQHILAVFRLRMRTLRPLCSQ